MTRSDPIYLLGGGGHASDVLNVIDRLGLRDDVAGCFDDRPEPHRMLRWGVRHLGELTGLRLDHGRFVFGIGMPSVKAKVLASIDVTSAQPISLVDPGAMVGFGATIEGGTVVLTGGCVSALARLGSHCLVGQNSPIGHDTVLGARCSVMPGAAISGDCEIGDDVLVGSNAVILQGLMIGAGATIGAGSVVTRDVSPGTMVVGAPARPIDPLAARR